MASSIATDDVPFDSDDNSSQGSGKKQKLTQALLEHDLLLRIYNDVVHSSDMPLLTAYLRDYDFYPPEVDPENLPLADHARAYLNNIPFLCLYYANIILRGVGQVYICNHPITGLLVCIGLYLTSPTLMVYGILGTIFENIGAFVVCRPPLDEVEAGLFGYDGTLVGCGVYTFLSMSDEVVRHPSLTNDGLLIMATLSFVVGVLHSTCANLSKLPALTLAFNITTLVFLMALARGTSTVATLTWMVDNPLSSVTVNNYWLNLDGHYYFDALFRGVGQFCFVDTTAGGVLVVAGIFLCSRTAGCMALLGSTTAMFMSRSVLILPRANKHLVRKGLFSYNAVGTCVALGGGIFYKSGLASTLVAMFGAALTVLMQTAVQSVLDTDGLGLPVLTIPFVLTAWLMMQCRSDWLVPIVGLDSDPDGAQSNAHKYEDTWLYRPKKKLFHETPARRLYRQRAEGAQAGGGGGVSSMAITTAVKPPSQRRGRGAWFPFRKRPSSVRRVKRVDVEEKKE